MKVAISFIDITQGNMVTILEIMHRLKLILLPLMVLLCLQKILNMMQLSLQITQIANQSFTKIDMIRMTSEMSIMLTNTKIILVTMLNKTQNKQNKTNLQIQKNLKRNNRKKQRLKLNQRLSKKKSEFFHRKKFISLKSKVNQSLLKRKLRM